MSWTLHVAGTAMRGSAFRGQCAPCHSAAQAPRRRRDRRVRESGHHLGKPSRSQQGHGPDITGSVAIVFSEPRNNLVADPSKTDRWPTTDTDQEAGKTTCRSRRATKACGKAQLPALPCHVGDADLWFAENPAELEQAKALCADCPIRRECLDAALEREEPWGVWGGEIFERGCHRGAQAASWASSQEPAGEPGGSVTDVSRLA